MGDVEWEMFPLNPATPGLGKEIDRVVTENELVIREWAPIHLGNMLKRWFWKDGVLDMPALDAWQKTCQYLYFPRLAGSSVMQSAIAAGAVSRDFFGLAYGKDDEGYRGFSYGQSTSPILDASLLLIEPKQAAAYEEKTRPVPVKPVGPSETSSSTATADSAETPPPATPRSSPEAARPTRYFASVELDPIKASVEFSKIVSELVELFSATPGTRVTIRVDVEAEDSRGFGESIVRAAKENGNTLRMKTSDFG